MINTLPKGIFKALFAFVNNYRDLPLRYFHAIDKNKLAATNGSVATIVKAAIDPNQEYSYEFYFAFDPAENAHNAFIADWDEDIELVPIKGVGEFPLTQAKFDELAKSAIEDGVEVFVNARYLKQICELAIAVAKENNKPPYIKLKVSKDKTKAVVFSTPSDLSWSAEGLLMPVEERK